MSSPGPVLHCPHPTVATNRPELARAVLAAVCARADLDHRGARLLRLVGNAVFELASNPVIVKIVLTRGLAHRARNAVAASALLARNGVPAIQPLPDVAAPLYLGGYAATFWRRVTDVGPPPDIDDLIQLLLRLHRLPARGLSPWRPVADLRARLMDARGVDPDDLRFLRDRCDAVEEALGNVRYELRPTVIHGDARIGNLIAGPDGPLLCDLDTTGIGPAEWDLVPVAVAQRRFGTGAVDGRTDHDRVAHGYGFDVTRWPGFPVLQEIRDLKLLCSALPAADQPGTGAELRQRLKSYRAGNPTGWTRYP